MLELIKFICYFYLGKYEVGCCLDEYHARVSVFTRRKKHVHLNNRIFLFTFTDLIGFRYFSISIGGHRFYYLCQITWLERSA